MAVGLRYVTLCHVMSPLPMTDPAGADILMLTMGDIDGIHATINIATPWIRHGSGSLVG